MIWSVSFVIMSVIIVLTIFFSVKYRMSRNDGILGPLTFIWIGLAVTLLVGIFPVIYVNVDYSSNLFIKFLEVLAISLARTFQAFTADLDSVELLEVIREHSFYFKDAYLLAVSVLCTIAPLLTVGALFSVFLSLSSKRRFFYSYFRDLNVFSELNERSVTLAADIRKHDPKTVFVFNEVPVGGSDGDSELISKAKRLGAILFRDDIMSISYKKHSPKSNISFFIIGKNETVNIEQTLNIIESYKDRDKTRLYLFSSSRESELALTGIQKDKIRVRRINEIQQLINLNLYENGGKLFDSAVKLDNDESKHINAVIIGLGAYGTEMLKALSWYCQMDGYKLTIDAFDKSAGAKSRFSMLCPDLINPKYNGVQVKGESDYTIRIHSGINADSSDLVDVLKNNEPATFVFISLGSDEENVKTAANMRMICGRLGSEPFIQTVVYNPKAAEILKNAKDFRKNSYNIEYIGSFTSVYSEKVILTSELEEKGLERHHVYDKSDEGFWEYEYNYRSSVASAIHKEARNHCHVKGNDKLNQLMAEGKGTDQLSDEEKEFLQCLEHKRWNAYMRGEGYVYGKPRNDMFKQHPCLVDYYSLDIANRKKDLF